MASNASIAQGQNFPASHADAAMQKCHIASIAINLSVPGAISRSAGILLQRKQALMLSQLLHGNVVACTLGSQHAHKGHSIHTRVTVCTIGSQHAASTH